MSNNINLQVYTVQYVLKDVYIPVYGIAAIGEEKLLTEVKAEKIPKNDHDSDMRSDCH